tara:strand:- start:377 stop:961 length:585 start_codon:yes stop_codon:yes gene_type:complete
MAEQNFWASPTVEPKRAYRWILNIGEVPIWICKKVTKPNFTITETPHKYLNHTFYYPGRVEWDKVSVTLVDPVQPDSAKLMWNILTKSGYRLHGDGDPSPHVNDTTTISKQNAISSLGGVILRQLGAEDDSYVEEWKLHNAWVSSVKFGELSYESEELLNVDIEIRYDWATIKGGELNNKGGTGAATRTDNNAL